MPELVGASLVLEHSCAHGTYFWVSPGHETPALQLRPPNLHLILNWDWNAH